MKRLAAALLAVLLPFMISAQDICLNGEWECGLGRNYDRKTAVPGIAIDPTQKADEALWYRKNIKLPEGDWTNAVLELKGARFRPSVYVNGKKCSSSEGGMTKTVHKLTGGVYPGNDICLEIELKSLNDVPKEDASFIPEVDQWRSNCSSCLWDDVVLHLYRSARVDRVTIDYDSAGKKALLKYRIDGGGAAEAEITISDGENVLIRQKSAIEGKETAVAINFPKTVKEWSPESPALYNLNIKLSSHHGLELSEYSQTVGFRDFRVKGKHFSMNGKPIGLRGGSVVWHRWVRDSDAKEVAFDAGWFGKNILKRIKDHGGNYIRFHLGVPPERILDLCDSLGLAVQYEWSFFHGMPASYESLVEQYGNWMDVAMKHPSVCLLHPYNETDEKELATAWKALNELVKQYPHVVLEDRDVLHIHRYWWGMSENLGLYYDSYKQFVKPIVVDEFGGIYLDRNGDMGGYPMIPKGMKRWLGENHTADERLHQQMLASGKVGEYWRRLGAAGIGVFPIASSFEDGNNWFLGDLSEGNPKPVWDVMTAVWSAKSVSMDLWDRNFTPGQKISVPVHLFNEAESADNLKILFSIKDADGTSIYSDTHEYKLGPYAETVVNTQFEMPSHCGSYTLSAQLLNPGEDVKYPVTSEWEIHILKARPSDRLASATVFIPDSDKELRAMAKAQNLHLTENVSEADLIVVDAAEFKNIGKQRGMLEDAIGRGAGVVMVNAGSRTLGKSYNDNARHLGQVSGSPKLATAEITHTDLFAGLSVNCVEVAEPESHIHPAHNDSSLWRGLGADCTRLWNGLRGGIIVPSADIEIGGLSQEAFLSGWAAKGADTEKIRKGEPVYAYEYCGFYRFDDKPASKETMEALRQQVAFLIEDMPAMALSLPIHTPIRITDLTAFYRINRGGRASGFSPMAEAGKDLVRNPVIRIQFGEGEGTLIISQVFTEHRLAEGYTEKRAKYPLHYDEAAVQFVLNMMDAAL